MYGESPSTRPKCRTLPTDHMTTGRCPLTGQVMADPVPQQSTAHYANYLYQYCQNPHLMDCATPQICSIRGARLLQSTELSTQAPLVALLQQVWFRAWQNGQPLTRPAGFVPQMSYPIPVNGFQAGMKIDRSLHAVPQRASIVDDQRLTRPLLCKDNDSCSTQFLASTVSGSERDTVSGDTKLSQCSDDAVVEERTSEPLDDTNGKSLSLSPRLVESSPQTPSSGSYVAQTVEDSSSGHSMGHHELQEEVVSEFDFMQSSSVASLKWNGSDGQLEEIRQHFKPNRAWSQSIRG